ncbi:hypothetical protein KOI35_32235 [Actinoplanes bogorensis]|uniref:Uncharacterized protein n=1 Tax=Paractinoplanes bogorensis TaxID=1610840 RepID=A0ABS5YXZ0_9ACTN|nr:hypothetical protein [Actinoplanes bogorensis]MBU2668191.1 hypothetical protein [Actinoplanes bogorensis]
MRGDRNPGQGALQHTVGNAVVLHTEEAISAEAQSLALTVVEDLENDVVVLDLGEGLPITSWESMAGVLPRRRRGIRLMACGEQRNAAAMAGQWFAERLGRTVIAPDGDLIRGAAGGLFVHSVPGSGWVRFRPGKPPAWHAKRYPTPLWDQAVTERRASSSTGEIEPLPGGVWIHDTREPEVVAGHRERLVADVPCQPEVMTVLLGCPGTPALSLDDVVRFWRELDEESRTRARFVQYGDIRLPEGEAFGQALADLLGTAVICYTGVPIGSPAKFEIRTVREDGVLGWPPFALELSYQPRAHPNSKGRRPSILSHRGPLRWVEEVENRVYWYAPDAVIEVVQAGLWVRPAEEPPNAERVRATRLDPEGSTLIFDDSLKERTGRMRELAEDLAARVDPTLGDESALFPASVLVPGQKPAGRADAVLSAALPVAPEPMAPIEAPVAAPALPAPPLSPVSVSPVDFAPPVEAPAPIAVPAAAAPLAPPPVARPSVPPAPVALPSVAPAPALPVAPALPASATSNVLATSNEVAAPASEVAARVTPIQPTPLAAPPVPPAAAVAPAEPVVIPEPVVPAIPAALIPAPPKTAPKTPAKPAEPEAAVDEVRRQPVPAAAASALLPKRRALDEERSWLRRTLSREFDTMASSVARIMSEHPGLQGSGAVSADDILADSVAVRLYLSRRGAGIDNGLRSGVTGPHVPLARCAVAGLSRLPSFRGTTVYRATPDGAEWDRYRERKLVTDWSFVNALTGPCESQEGDTDVLVWSMTARRTALLEPDGDERVEDRVLFLPGTHFKVLELREPSGDERGAVLMREIGANEIGEDGRVDPDRVSLDELAVTSLRRSIERWATADPKRRVGAAAGERFGLLPGLERAGVGAR